MIKIKLNCSKIPKDRIFHGEKGKYIDLVLFDKPDNYGNDGFIAVDVSKEDRDSGAKGQIVGNWRELGSKQPRPVQKQPPKKDPDLDQDQDSIPF